MAKSFIGALKEFRSAPTKENESNYVDVMWHTKYYLLMSKIGDQISFYQIQHEGSNILPVFTDATNIGFEKDDNDSGDYRLFPTSMETIRSLLSHDDSIAFVAVDPFTEGIPVFREQLDTMYQVFKSDSSIEANDEALDENEVKFGIVKPNDIPTRLQYELAGLADDYPGQVKKMNLLWISNNRVKNYWLIIDGPNEDVLESLIPKLEKIFWQQLNADVDVQLKSRQNIGEEWFEYPFYVN